MTQIFSDDFESGDFSAWTGTEGSPTIEANNPHHGTYNAVTTASDTSLCYRTLSQAATVLYCRTYQKWSANPSSGTDTRLIMFRNSAGTLVASLRLYNIDNIIQYRVVASGITPQAYVTTPNTNQYYCLELYYKIASGTNGEASAWVDGTQIMGVAGVDTSTASEVAAVHIGIQASTGYTHTRYWDCVVIADTYIGPEGEVTVQTVIDSFSLADNLFRNKPVPIADALNAADALKGNKTLHLTDLLHLSAAPRVLKTLNAMDGLILSDTASTPMRILQSNDEVALIEIVQAGVGGAKKTRLFLILGDLALGIDNR